MNNTNTHEYNHLNAFVITNAFSINMLGADSDLKFSRLKETEARWIVGNFPHSSAVGHADTAAAGRVCFSAPCATGRVAGSGVGGSVERSARPVRQTDGPCRA